MPSAFVPLLLDYATETTLALVRTAVDAINAKLPAALGRTAAAGSLSTALSTEDAAKVPALGQALAAGSVPVVLPAAQAAGALALQAQLPAALGQLARASSLSVTQSTEDAAKVPSLGQALAAGCVPVVLPAAQAAGALALQAQLPAALGPTSPAASLSTVNTVARIEQNATFPVAGIQIKATPGTVFSCTWTNTTGSTVYIQFFDASAQPGAGDSPLWYSGAIASGNIGSGGMGHIMRGVPCPTTGIRAVLSSTQGTYTAIVSTSFKSVFFYE